VLLFYCYKNMNSFSVPTQHTVEIRAIQGGTCFLKESMILNDGDENKEVECQSWAFLIKHNDTLSMFDLGIRKDFRSESPVMNQFFEKIMKPKVLEDVAEALERHNISPSSIQHVIFSHPHWDHTGNSSIFPNATLTFGRGTQAYARPAYPLNPDSYFLESTFVVGRTRELTDKDYTTHIGPFPHAHDFFGDGSFYLLEAEGHMPGHQVGLAHTEKGFILLAGDACHHCCQLTAYATRMSYAMHTHPTQAKETLSRMDELSQQGVRICLAHAVYKDFEKLTA